MIKKILGFFGQNNQWTHDHSFALSENGQITDYIQLERLTRKKFDNTLPDKLVSILNDTNNLKYELNNLEIGYVNTFALDSNFFKKADNNIISTNKDIEFTAKGSSLLEPVEVTGKISGEKVDATIIPHELAHVFSLVPFYGLFKNNSLLIHVDGAASICNASAWVFRNNHIQLLEKTSIFHHALLNFYYNDLTFDMLKIPKTKHFSMPGKLMGYASYGTVSTEMLSWLKERDLFRDYSEHPKTQLLNEAQKMFQNYLKTLETRHTFS